MQDDGSEEGDAGSKDARKIRVHWLAALLDDPESSPQAQAVQYFIICLILGSTALTIVETVPEFRGWMGVFCALDCCVTALFTAELTIRFYVNDPHQVFCLDPFNLVDIVALVPGYVQLGVLFGASGDMNTPEASGSMRALRVIRFFRLVRIARVMRLVKEWHYAEQMALLFKVMLEVMSSGLHLILLLLGLMIVVGSTLIYLFEAGNCDLGAASGWSPTRTGAAASGPILPRSCLARSQFDSIPSAFWWSLTTLTTIGYGDMVPVTPLGKVVGGAMCIAGVMIIAIGAATFSLEFGRHWERELTQLRFRKQFSSEDHDGARVLEEQEEVERLILHFERTLEDLVNQVQGMALSASGGPPRPAEPLLTSIREHKYCLISGTRSLAYEGLQEAMAPAKPKGLPKRGSTASVSSMDRASSDGRRGSPPRAPAP